MGLALCTVRNYRRICEPQQSWEHVLLVHVAVLDATQSLSNVVLCHIPVGHINRPKAIVVG
jgi:hypothetical protein